MFKTASILGFLFIFIGAATLAVSGQVPPSPLPSSDATLLNVVGQAEVFYFKKTDRTKASIYLTLLGNTKANDKEDSLSLSVSYEVVGKKPVEPDVVSLRITSRSDRPKYSDNHKVTFYVGGETGLRMVFEDPRQISRDAPEQYLVYMPYKFFRELSNGKDVLFTIGDTKVTLTSEQVQALKDLDNTIER